MAESTIDVTNTAEEKHAKKIEIIVNAESYVIEDDIVSYEQVVNLAFPVPPSPNMRITVSFRNAKEPKDGTLIPGGTVEVKKHGSIFNVTATGRS